MGGDEDESSKGFKFQDKRRIFKEGEEPEDAEGASADLASPVRARGLSGGRSELDERVVPPDSNEHPVIPTFAGLLMSFATNGLAGLGLIPDPLSEKTEVDLVRAQQSIGILELLQEKTKGNLAPQEAQMMEGILYELRLKYVEVNAAKSLTGDQEGKK